MKLSLPKPVFFFFFFAVFLLLPFYLLTYFVRSSYFFLVFFYALNAAIGYILVRRHSRKKDAISLKTSALEEKINVLNNQLIQENKNIVSFKEKIRRYNALKVIVEEINRNLALEPIASSLTAISFSLVGNNKGLSILYLINQENQKLSLYKSKKEDKKLIIKAKEGDIFDLWVLRRMRALLVEDIKKDFRFDLEAVRRQQARDFASLISSPLMTENSLLGLLRLDNPMSGFFTQDDLRLLVTISELGAVALENGELFQKTQDLAIHDGLTKLYTKGYLFERLKDECKRSFRQGSDLSLLMLDIDYFKDYNDKFGHTAGDIVLSTLSSTILEFLDEFDPIVGRFGGEEFCVILPHVDKARANTIANGLLVKIANTKITLRRQETNITVSIGLATCPVDAAGEDELIFKADRALYEAKQKGRNRVVNA